MSNTDQLLVVLNTTNLQKTDNRLYQVIKDLIGNLLKNEQNTTAIAAVVSPSGTFVTSTIGGTADNLAMFTAPHNIENVTAAGISAALDLL